MPSGRTNANSAHAWIVLGAALIIAGVCLGMTGTSLFPYSGIAGIGIGVALLVKGVFVIRQRQTGRALFQDSYDEYLEQTCELNVRTKELRSAVPHPPQD